MILDCKIIAMARPPNIITPEQDLFWVDALRALEARETTREQIMAISGVSSRTLDRRVARAKEMRGEFEAEEPDGTDRERELPWVPLVHGEHDAEFVYRLDRDEESRLPVGPFRIGDHNGRRLRVQHAGNGQPVEGAAKSKAKFKPKKPRRKKLSPAPAG